MKYLFFDTETCGLPKNYNAPVEDVENYPRLVQLAYIFKEGGKESVKHNAIVKPDGFIIPESASKIHGITQQIAEEEGIEIKYILKAFLNAVELADVIIGHNISFDEKIVGAEFIRMFNINHLKGKMKICTMLSSVNYCKIPSTNGYGGYKWAKLQELYKCLFGKEFEGAHDALSDITATEECFYKLRELGVITIPGQKEEKKIEVKKEKEKPMKIVELYGENIKRLKAVRIKPNDGITVISGANAQGKSSVLDIVWLALKGAEAGKQNPEVIHKGEDNATVQLDLGEYLVTRKFTESGSVLEVKNKEGAKFPSPQAMLDKLIGSISLDPLAFLNYDSDKQRKLMLSFTDLTVALSHKDVEIKKVYDDRTFINKQLEKEASVLKTFEEVDIPDDVVENRGEIDLEEVRKRLQKAISVNESAEKQRTLRKSIEDRIHELKIELKSWENKRTLEMGNGEIKSIDTTSIVEELKQGEVRNKHIETLNKFEKQSELVQGLDERSATLSEQLDILRKERMDAIKGAKYPLDGLGITDDGITFNDIPFIQLSSAEKLKVSVAMATALNPTLKVIRIVDGSLLDSKSMVMLEELAEKNDMQILIEKVDETGKVGIVISDGEVVADNYAEPKTKKVKK